MIRHLFGAVAAVVLVAIAVHVAATPWAMPLALAAAGIGCLVVAREGSLR